MGRLESAAACATMLLLARREVFLILLSIIAVQSMTSGAIMEMALFFLLTCLVASPLVAAVVASPLVAVELLLPLAGGMREACSPSKESSESGQEEDDEETGEDEESEEERIIRRDECRCCGRIVGRTRAAAVHEKQTSNRRSAVVTDVDGRVRFFSSCRWTNRRLQQQACITLLQSDATI